MTIAKGHWPCSFLYCRVDIKFFTNFKSGPLFRWLGLINTLNKSTKTKSRNRTSVIMWSQLRNYSLQVFIWYKPLSKAGQCPKFRILLASLRTAQIRPRRFPMFRVRPPVATYASMTIPVRRSSTTTPRSCASLSRMQVSFQDLILQGAWTLSTGRGLKIIEV